MKSRRMLVSAAVEKANPNVTIEIQAVPTALLAFTGTAQVTVSTGVA